MRRRRRLRARLLAPVLLAAALSGCWEWDVFVPENPDVCGTHVPPVTGALTVVDFSLIDVAARAEVPGLARIPAGATLELAALPRQLNIRANTAPAVVGGVLFALDGMNAAFEYAPPYMLAGDIDCAAEYRVWRPPAAGPHTLTGTALRGATATSERGGTATLTFTIR